MKLKNILKLLTASTLVALLAITTPAATKKKLENICLTSSNKCYSSINLDLDGDGDKEYLTIKETTKPIGEYCGYTLGLRDIDFRNDRTIVYFLYNVLKADLSHSNKGYIIKISRCSTETEQAETGVGEPEISEVINYVWNGERLIPK